MAHRRGGGSRARVAGCGTPTRRWWCRRERGQVWHTDTTAGRGEQTRGTQLRDLRAASSHVWPGATRAGVVGEARARGRLGRSALVLGWVRGLRRARRANAQWPGVAHRRGGGGADASVARCGTRTRRLAGESRRAAPSYGTSAPLPPTCGRVRREPGWLGRLARGVASGGVRWY